MRAIRTVLLLTFLVTMPLLATPAGMRWLDRRLQRASATPAVAADADTEEALPQPRRLPPTRAGSRPQLDP